MRDEEILHGNDDTNLYDAQLNLSQAEEQESASPEELYVALGGSWQEQRMTLQPTYVCQ